MVTITPWPMSEFSMRVIPTPSDPHGNGLPPPNHVNTPATPVWVPGTIVEILQASAPRRVRIVVLSPVPFYVQANEFDALAPRYGTFRTIGPTLLSETFALDSPSIAAGAQLLTGALAVPGAQLGDPCNASWSADLQGMQLTAYVSATGFCRAIVQNGPAGPTVNLAPGTLRIDCWRHA